MCVVNSDNKCKIIQSDCDLLQKAFEAGFNTGYEEGQNYQEPNEEEINKTFQNWLKNKQSKTKTKCQN